MKEKWGRVKFTILSEASRLFARYKYYLLVFFVLFLICFITGIMTCINYSSSISCDNLINTYLLGYLQKSSSWIGFFLIMSLFFLIISLFIIIFTRNILFVIMDILILLLTSYILGFDICIIIISLGLSGVIFGILVYGLLGILTMLIIMFILSIAVKRLRDKQKMCPSIDNSQYFKVYLLLLILGLLVLLVMSILFGIIHIFVIVD